MKKPMITAHSGCEGTGIDTMDSIEKAIQYGADAIEIDIRMDPFGVLRISHDPLSLEDYLQKNPLEKVFQKVLPTSLMINFDLKEDAALYKTINAARDFGFPTDRLIFSGCTKPEQLTNDTELVHKANFYLNLEKVLLFAYKRRSTEFTREAFSILMEDPYIIFLDENIFKPEIYLSRAIRLKQNIFAISQILKEKVLEETVRIYQETRAAAANLPKFLLWTSIDDMLKEENIPLSFWTVNEPELVHRCLDIGACNITTRNIKLTKQILSEIPS